MKQEGQMVRIYLDWLSKQYEAAKLEARRSHKAETSHYSAGYDQGYVDALQRAMEQLKEREQ